MQVVVVDMGPDASAEQTAWVLEACTSAIRNGSCVAEPLDDEEPPRAVAIVRVRDTAGRIVRIEVGRRREERALWSLRELEFSSRDPDDERWRSVGLALATLVGEIEDSSVQPEPAAPEARAEEPLPPESGSSSPAQNETDRTVGVDAEPAAPDADEHEPLPRPRAFFGVGALAGQGSGAQLLRWGGGARAAWLSGSGLQLSIAGDYSTVNAEPGLELDWLKLSSGAGYRHFVSERWSFGFTLRAGVRGLGTVAEEGAERHSKRRWSFLMAGSADGWWQVARQGGLWLELELGTIGRTTHLLDEDGEVESKVPFGDACGLFGVWLSL